MTNNTVEYVDTNKIAIENIPVELPKWIKNERVSQGMSIEELAKRSNMTKLAVKQIEDYGSNPRISASFRIIDALGYSMHLRNGKMIIESNQTRGDLNVLFGGDFTCK